MWMECDKQKKVEGMTLWSLKMYDRIVVKLKAIDHKENLFYYLSS